jgi:hypothetical protein
MKRWIWAVTALLGCNHWLGIDDTHPEPDGPPPPPPDAACAAGAPQTASFPAVADAVIIDDGFETLLGTASSVNVSYSLRSRGVWRFDTSGLAAGAIIGFAVVLPYLPADDACGHDPCSPCTSFEEDGAIELYPIASDWLEPQTTWSFKNRAAMVRWNQAGADGTDRGPLVSVADHVALADTRFDVGGRAVADTVAWIRGGLVSFVAIPKADQTGTHGARTLVVSAQLELACAPPPPAHLEVTYCR